HSGNSSRAVAQLRTVRRAMFVANLDVSCGAQHSGIACDPAAAIEIRRLDESGRNRSHAGSKGPPAGYGGSLRAAIALQSDFARGQNLKNSAKKIRNGN